MSSVHEAAYQSRAFVSVDVEQDISLYLRDSFQGVEEGIPRLLDLFAAERVRADFFIQGSLLPDHADVLAEIPRKGHGVGVHGFRHHRLFLRPGFAQGRLLARSTDLVAQATGARPRMFRAPGFSISEGTFDVLEHLGYDLDSSVMPGAVLRMLRRKIVVELSRGAPRVPYHPARGDFLAEGARDILEVPLTENPEFAGAPVGLGYLNTRGIEATIRALDAVPGPYCTFLLHSWEAVDLGAHHPGLPEYVRQECSADLGPLRTALGALADRWTLDTLTSLRGRTGPRRGAAPGGRP